MQSLLRSARAHRERTAVVDDHGDRSYGRLLDDSGAVALRIRARTNPRDGAGIGSPVAYLIPPGYDHVAIQWGIWRAGCMAVPLATSHPERELAYVLDDASPRLVIAHPDLAPRVRDLAADRTIPFATTEEMIGDEGPETTSDGGETSDLPEPGPDVPALMIYTSGTTGRPKGVVHTHGSLTAQAESLIEAWGWSRDDHILLVLPLHHVHGIVNVLLCALTSGAACTIHPGFEAQRVWRALADGTLTLFMAVPTIYHKLIEAWEGRGQEERTEWSDGARALRLMVSGSAALPETVLARWRELTGHTLLERYGMSETGMILSNPLDGERRAGHVGRPVPGMDVRLVRADGEILARRASPTPAGRRADDETSTVDQGEVQVRGPALFEEYFRRPEATAEAFTEDGWFQTGDVAVLDRGSYRLLGRRSVDILKTGGYKVSALEIESVLLEHPGISECAVIGVPDPEWGQRVCAFVVARPVHDGGDGGMEGPLEGEGLRSWAKERLAPYKVPSLVRVVEQLPRNALGKVQKPRLLDVFEAMEGEVADA